MLQQNSARNVQAAVTQCPGKGIYLYMMDTTRILSLLQTNNIYIRHRGRLCQFSQMLCTHLPSGAGRTGQLVADVPGGLGLAPNHET